MACAITAFTLLTGLSGCAKDAVDTIQLGETNACAADRKTVEVAVETFYANGGASGTASMVALVSAGLLREPSTSFTVERGLDVVAIPGGLCDTGGTGTTGTTAAPAAAAGFTPEQCEADRITLQGAVDAFGAAYSVSPMDEAELVRAGLLTVEVQGYDLQGATVVPAAGVCA